MKRGSTAQRKEGEARSCAQEVTGGSMCRRRLSDKHSFDKRPLSSCAVRRGLPATPRAARRIKMKPETKGVMSGSAPPLTRLAQRRVLTAEMHGQCDRRLHVMSRFRKAARPLPSLPGVPGAPALPPAVSRIPPLPPPSSCSFPDSSELPLTFTCPQLQGPSRLLQKCPLLLSTCEQECSQTGRGEGGDVSSILSLDC